MMFRNVRNDNYRGTPIERTTAAAVGRRLPPGWSSDIRVGDDGRRGLTIHAPDGRCAQFLLRPRRRLSPREVPNLICQFGGSDPAILVVAPFLSPRVRELLAEAGISFVDATGNLRVVVTDPAVFLEKRGEDRDPDRQPRPLRSLKGSAAGRVVRALCDFVPPYGVRQLAQISSIPLGTVSRVVSFLEEEALLTRGGRKQVAAVDWRGLINRWVRDYGVQTSNRTYSYLDPRGLTALPSKLADLDRYAVTGSMVGPTIAPTRLAMIYVDDAEAAGSTLGLSRTDAGANVWLLEPYDEVVFDRTELLPTAAGRERTVVVAAAPSQVAADLLTSPGRGPQEGESLIPEMEVDEKRWRHEP